MSYLLFATNKFKHEVRKQKLKHDSDVKKLDICIQTTTSIVHDGYLKLSAHREQTVCTRKDLYLLISQVVKSVIYDQYRKLNTQRRSASSDTVNNNGECETSELHAA
jgi:DNA-directed RNA polymerase specialized sigma24 family protein